MIYRGFVGKEFPPFVVEISEELAGKMTELFGNPKYSVELNGSLPCNWPAVLALKGAVCFIPVWEALGIDPLALRLAREEFVHHSRPDHRYPLTGLVAIEEITEHVEALRGIEEQVDLLVRFRGSDDTLVAEYRCSYRTPVAKTAFP